MHFVRNHTIIKHTNTNPVIPRKNDNSKVPFHGVDSDVIDLKPVVPDIVGPDVVGPDVVNTDVVNAAVVNTDVVGPDVVGPDVVGPDVVKTDVVNTEVVGAEVVGTEVVGTEVGLAVNQQFKESQKFGKIVHGCLSKDRCPPSS